MTRTSPVRQRPFYLLTENCLDASYLIVDWLSQLRHAEGFRGILVRDAPDQRTWAEKVAFHRRHSGRTRLSPDEVQELLGLYSNSSGYSVMPGFAEAFVALYGVPEYPEPAAGESLPIRFIGQDLNTPELFAWLDDITAGDARPVLFIWLSKILKQRWIDAFDGWIINSHPAVLPYARGMWAIEQVVMEGVPENVRRCAGASVHFVNAGIDTGDIIRVAGIDPFQSRTLPELSARVLRLATRMLVRTARSLAEHPEEHLRGVSVDPRLLGPNYKNKDFDEPAAAEQAVKSFERMLAQVVRS
ncbi:hypothetical protein SOCE836_024940 [Sorangium cellulosum]|uniref:phosphoribosylglycinamide formyltransferase 1 n=1 Tax=Sorangium cellulosum TaxID=56 RepID=A0A4P2QKZ6_SORCE|nr:hypothetical protein SOCE836_024940 [Sorangium cellulosum]WCQ89785.1 cyanobacterial phosphoribosylglycinamide formyltransferase [Sorangium sp. Soce836]